MVHTRPHTEPEEVDVDRDTALLWIKDAAERSDALTGDAPVGPSAAGERINPTCGDRVNLVVHLDDAGRVCLRGSVRGCVLSTAAANVAAITIDGLSIHAALDRVDRAVNTRLAGAGSTSVDDDLDELATLELVPLRRRCVALPWQLTADLLRELAAGG